MSAKVSLAELREGIAGSRMSHAIIQTRELEALLALCAADLRVARLEAQHNYGKDYAEAVDILNVARSAFEEA